MKALVFSVLAIASMVACTSESDPINEVDNKPVEIKMTAGINVVTTKTSGPIVPAAAVDDVVFVRADGTVLPVWITGTVTPIDATIAATSGAISFGSDQFYPTNGESAYLVGYHPKAKGTLAAGVVTYTGLTGQEDIMYAAVVSGTKTSAATPLEPKFNHKLTQISFKAFATTEAAAAWGEVTSIELVNQKTEAALALADGSLAFTGTPVPLSVLSTSTAIPSDPDVSIGKSIMVEAAQAKYQVLVKTVENPTGVTIDLKDGTGAANLSGTASTAYTVLLTFQGKNISANASIGVWTPSTGQGTIE